MTLLDGILVLGILFAFGYMILVKLLEKNPRFRKSFQDISFNKIIEKTPMKENKDKIMQVYDERRTMM